MRLAINSCLTFSGSLFFMCFTAFHEGVSLMTMNRTEGGRCLRIAWKTCLAILGALATGAPAIRPAYGQHITR